MANELREVGYMMPATGTVVYVPSADSIQSTVCASPGCGALHVFLMDHLQQPFAEMALSEEVLEGMLARLREGKHGN